MSGLARLNALPPAEAEAELRTCCGSREWARQVAARRPFRDEAELLEAADAVWWGLGREDWLEAFRSHPRIGERGAEAPRSERERRWSEGEQAGVGDAEAAVRRGLTEGNRAYEARFGHLYIVCATGKSGAEMLELLRRRLAHDPGTELRVAAEEQRRITRLRLAKLLASDPETVS
ncbi:MAG TPA: 2-oxo-4-hydroxy-4-carboxy-5-ureidoimidazoline decarboxylase [Longimicrobiaceae bacterium]|nr:2-oxo-4-hydroxy-4-carboxy-5-ureidoimidazoline decarboxylase [Longimicrobiaceae bacterium]